MGRDFTIARSWDRAAAQTARSLTARASLPGSRYRNRVTGRSSAITSAPPKLVQMKGAAARMPPRGPATSDISPSSPVRRALRRPVAPRRWPSSTSIPPTLVLMTTSATLSPVISAMKGQ